MKLFISLIVLAGGLQANQIVVYSENGLSALKAIKERLTNKYEIPSSLISSYLVKECPRELKEGRALYLCANKKELEVLNSSPSDIESIIESLAVFKSEV